jgi:hypothetical protein
MDNVADDAAWAATSNTIGMDVVAAGRPFKGEKPADLPV